MEKYISEWISVIKRLKNDNTYKASWGKAILECIMKKEYEEIDGEIIIEEYFIVQKILKYYWNLNVYFHIRQGDFLIVEKMTTEIHEDYLKRHKNGKIWYDKAERFMKRDQVKYEKDISKLLRIVNDNVAHRFLNVGRKKIKLYRLDKRKKCLVFTMEQIDLIQKYFNILNDLINYRWAMYLEIFNRTDHLIRKIVLVSEDNYNTKKLNYYKQYLSDFNQ